MIEYKLYENYSLQPHDGWIAAGVIDLIEQFNSFFEWSDPKYTPEEELAESEITAVVINSSKKGQGEVIGYETSASLSDGLLFLNSAVVGKDWRGLGMWEELTDMIINSAKKSGKSEIKVVVSDKSTFLKNFLIERGFEDGKPFMSLEINN